MGAGDTYDVFVSYARSDEAVAAELNGWICAQGLRTFFDRSELRPGLRWIPALENAIERSHAVVILVGKHGIGNTQQYERELALACQSHNPELPVIPVLMPGCGSPPTGFLRLVTWVDLSKGSSVLSQTDNLAALRAAICGQPVTAAAARASVCPYRGLEAFHEEDAPFFCGRDEAIDDLVAKVQSDHFVAVVGPSGSGKSSLVFAGLLPALRRESRTRTWDVVTLRPGKSPLRALGGAFGTAPKNGSLADIDAYLEQQAQLYRTGDDLMLSRIVDLGLDAAPEKPDRLLIYVDQAEELYAMGPGPENEDAVQKHSDDVETFLELLARAGERASVVLTIRVDFYGQLMRSPSVSRLLPAQQVNIRLMRPDDLRSAIVTPAKLVGLDFSPPELVVRMLDDLGQQEGRLPLLQFALKEIWERREGNKLTADAYMEVGGVTGAIETTAEDVYNRLTPEQKNAARRLFLGLVTPGEGQEDTRARALIPDDPKQKEIIALFSDPSTRLLVTDLAPLQASGQDGSESRATVEVAHEALIQRWPTLKSWLDANRDKLRDRAAILRAMADWDQKDRSDDYLLPRGVQVERGRALLRDPGDVRIDDICDYVTRSVKFEDDRVVAEQEETAAKQKLIAEAERQAREAAEESARQAARRAAAETELRTTAEEKTQVEQAARNNAEASARKLRRMLTVAVLAATFAVAFAGAAYYGFTQALRQRELADRESTRADWQTRETQRQLDRANQALAESIDNDLGIERDQPLTERQRNALWRLALADDAVKKDGLRRVFCMAASPQRPTALAAISARNARSSRTIVPSGRVAGDTNPPAVAE
jgi:energy-coupling factor transporter ATP-binding protein EcfA2